jgi:hypothetical protein
VMAMVDLRRQFSLDYLTNESNAPASKGAEELDRAVILYSQPILTELRKAADKQMRIHDLVRILQGQNVDVGSFEDFLGVIHRLAALKIIKIAEKDLTGNHLIQLTA